MPGMHRRPVGPGPGGPQGNISASLLPSLVPWALPGMSIIINLFYQCMTP